MTTDRSVYRDDPAADDPETLTDGSDAGTGVSR